MKKCAIVGASGYTGMALAGLIAQHPEFCLTALSVSSNSDYLNQPFSQCAPVYQGIIELPLTSWEDLISSPLWHEIDIVFLATPHEFSADVVPSCRIAGKLVVDLSGAYRLKDPEQFNDYYHFQHPHQEWLTEACYGLPEVNANALTSAQLIAVAGCYPTSALVALKPFIEHQWVTGTPVIHSVSGVSGAGRKASLKTTLCELSLEAYGVDTHRHQPEIEQCLNHPVIFTPHLGAFPRGIHTSVTAELTRPYEQTDVYALLEDIYAQHPLVRIKDSLPAIHHVAHTPFIDIAARVINSGQHLQLFVAIDNLLKGAASQAVQCANLASGLPSSLGLFSPSSHAIQGARS
ncbi:N-acetyl-gamma-glutamyl-phosphate reductase [Pleionea sp. CnH1-48]|uniref:N-acetyl-gamma-glutamyl-phosphate reductase n=1 Tax=Pleionea sp. CnH1-48 TaxID=2954494 RepID=UPI002097EB44|nr:N-acetyl-gamma-glutamyl-phosphate reductase [Pleionea sp. CnH1-48]MCO7224453.1 N-acetyl-gamma-glutamyl-phosphate reductase [Pleionea sp. CnH1-48]